MPSFEHLQASARHSFDDAQTLRDTKPEVAMASRSHGHEALASYLLANGDPGYRPEIEALLRNELARFEAFGTSIRTLPQPKYLLLALAIGDISTARAFASLPIDRKNWATFDSAFVYRICEILRIPQQGKLPKAKATQTEQVFLAALDSIAQGGAYDPDQIEAFWRTLRNKRYELTIFQHFNAFNPALSTLSAV